MGIIEMYNLTSPDNVYIWAFLCGNLWLPVMVIWIFFSVLLLNCSNISVVDCWVVYATSLLVLVTILGSFCSANMDGQSSQNELQLMSLDFGGNDYGVSQLAENHPYQNYFLADGSNGFHYMSPPLPQWIRCQQNTPKYVEFLAENGVSELQGDISHSDISSMTCSFQHAVPFLDMDVKQVK